MTKSSLIGFTVIIAALVSAFWVERSSFFPAINHDKKEVLSRHRPTTELQSSSTHLPHASWTRSEKELLAKKLSDLDIEKSEMLWQQMLLDDKNLGSMFDIAVMNANVAEKGWMIRELLECAGKSGDMGILNKALAIESEDLRVWAVGQFINSLTDLESLKSSIVICNKNLSADQKKTLFSKMDLLLGRATPEFLIELIHTVGNDGSYWDKRFHQLIGSSVSGYSPEDFQQFINDHGFAMSPSIDVLELGYWSEKSRSNPELVDSFIQGQVVPKQYRESVTTVVLNGYTSRSRADAINYLNRVVNEPFGPPIARRWFAYWLMSENFEDAESAANALDLGSLRSAITPIMVDHYQKSGNHDGVSKWKSQ